MSATSQPYEQSGVLAAPHQPPYAYHESSGYEAAVKEVDSPSANQSEPSFAEGSFDEDAQTESEAADDDIFDHEFISTNPGDYTKSYNRHRRLLDSNTPGAEIPRINPQQKPKANVAALIDDQISSLARHAGKIKLDDQAAGVKHGSSGLGQERSDRATSEQVLDPRTRMILLQLINRGIVSEVHGCISTGKEANVYHAIVDPVGSERTLRHLAIKVYKTAILHFKDRSKYVSGEYRFQKGFAKRSNRGMVRLWAEKEFRNLKRMHSAGLPVPEPIHLKSHVLVMELVGSASKNGRITPAPLLRDIEFDEQAQEETVSQWSSIYRQTLGYMRKMYQICKLVHADLSEYNMLYDSAQRGLTIIDVSQSVEHDHPRSLDFLRMDIKNVSGFFSRKGVETLTEPSVFHFVAREQAVAKGGDIYSILDHLARVPITSEASDEVFRQQCIPQTLNQVPNFELKPNPGANGEDTTHGILLARDGESDTVDQASSNGDSPLDDADSSDEAASSPNSEGHCAKSPRPRGKRFEDKATKKEHKAAVKEDKRERRKTKMPKQLKKRLVTTKSRSQKK